MRVNERIVALSAIVGLGGFGPSACEKGEETGPAPGIAQVSHSSPVAADEPEAPSAPARGREQLGAEDRRGPDDRTTATLTMLAAMERGEFGQAFKYLADDVVWTEVGLPDGQLASVAAVVAYQQRSRTGFSDFRIQASRIIASADYQAVEFVWSARHSGAFADGVPATDKVATVPGAMLIRHREDGLIDRVWVFQDWPNALQQLGLAPNLPADFRSLPFPERTEIVIGPDEPDFRERYASFVSRLGPNDYRATLAERTADDFTWVDLLSGRHVQGRDAAAAHLDKRMQSFALQTTEIQTVIAAGSYLAAFVKNQLVYQGGYLDVPAKGQEITTHTLDIVQFDADKLRFKALASYGNSYEILSALQVTAKGPGHADAKDPRFGIEPCDEHIADMRQCLISLDDPMRETVRVELERQIARWQKDNGSGATRDEMMSACRFAHVVAKTSLAAACPRVAWD